MNKLTIREIYIGNILQVDIKKSENSRGIKKIISSFTMVKENAILLHVCNHGYVDIDNIDSRLIFKSIKGHIYNEDSFNISELILPDTYISLPGKYIFIDKKSLQECAILNEDEVITYSMIKNLKKEINKKRVNK